LTWGISCAIASCAICSIPRLVITGISGIRFRSGLVAILMSFVALYNYIFICDHAEAGLLNNPRKLFHVFWRPPAVFCSPDHAFGIRPVPVVPAVPAVPAAPFGPTAPVVPANADPPVGGATPVFAPPATPPAAPAASNVPAGPPTVVAAVVPVLPPNADPALLKALASQAGGAPPAVPAAPDV
jgi:hypothetical protein